MRTLFIGLLFFLLPSIAASSNALYQMITPSSLKEIKLSESPSKKELQKLLGKPSLIKGEKHLYEVDKRKYPLSIEFKDEKVSKISATYIKQPILLDQVVEQLKKSKTPYKVSTEGQTYSELTVPSLGLKFKVKYGSKVLYSIQKEYK